MNSQASDDNGPDFTQGVRVQDFGARELLRGHIGDDAVVLARVGDEYFAVGASCTHYGGPLDAGIVVGHTVMCPLHHARFSLQSGEAVGAPAFDPLPRWNVVRDGDRLVVRDRAADAPAKTLKAPADVRRVVIVGGGAAGFACAEMLRRRGYAGELTILSADADAPYDRPNISKGYLAGEAPEEWIPLRPGDYYAGANIDLQLDTEVTAIDTRAKTVTTRAGTQYPYDRLVLATGAEPVRLPIPGAEQAHVRTLRSLADSRAIIAVAEKARSAVVLGSGFIGLEVAAALRDRKIDVQVVSLDKAPLEHVLGHEVGSFVRQIHEGHGVKFHMEDSIESIGASQVKLRSGTELPADLVIIGVGVRPRTALAEQAGIATDHGVLVDAQLRTSAPDVYAAGDIASWPGTDGARLRVEHWVVAERQGQVVAENILGAGETYGDAPFFWSMHYDTAIRYVGHGGGHDRIEIDGTLASGHFLARYKKGGATLAVAAIGRDIDVLQCGCQMERAA